MDIFVQARNCSGCFESVGSCRKSFEGRREWFGILQPKRAQQEKGAEPAAEKRRGRAGIGAVQDAYAASRGIIFTAGKNNKFAVNAGQANTANGAQP